MTLLPQLEHELLAAHERQQQRRQRAGRRFGRLGLALATAVALAVVLVAVSRVGHRHQTAAGHAPAFAGPTTAWTPARILLTGVEQPSAYAAGKYLFVVPRGGSSASGSSASQLERVDPSTGKVVGVATLGSTVDHVLLVGGHLWATTTQGQKTTLWRLNPRDLTGRVRTILPGAGVVDGDVGSLAAAGGWLWVGNANSLVRVSLASGRVTATVAVPGAQGVEVAASSDGRTLLSSAGHAASQVQRRDPGSGAVLKRSATFAVVTKPRIGGVIDGGAWIAWSGGMMGAAQRLDLRTLRPTQVPPALGTATNGIEARVLDGILWVTEPGGAAVHNYCGDPATGQPRLVVPFLSARSPSSLLTASGRYVYFAVGKGGPKGQALVREVIPRRCR